MSCCDSGVGVTGRPGRKKSDAPPGQADKRELNAVIAGNPNSGKTTLFNALTGLHQRVGNYPGITVERKQGAFSVRGTTVRLTDLPGTYSLGAASGDERIVRDMLLGLLPQESAPDVIVIVVDASQLERNLFLASQLMQLGVPCVVALTMNDEARRKERAVDVAKLEARLRIPVVEVLASRGTGISELRETIFTVAGTKPAVYAWEVSLPLHGALDELAALIKPLHSASAGARLHLALQLLYDEDGEHPLCDWPGVRERAAEVRARLEAAAPGWREEEARWRYRWSGEVAEQAARHSAYKPSRSDLVDRVVAHPVAGVVVFIAVMIVAFQCVFAGAAPLSGWLQGVLGGIAAAIGGALPAGPLVQLLTDGVLGGVGAVVAFVPQIALLFLFIAVLEDSGYMARAAFVMNRHMRRAGLHGKAFVPLLSGFSCAVPGIMATRTISDPRERLVTILTVPLASCSARVPVYALMIAAFIPAIPLFGPFNAQGAVMAGIYLLSLVAAVTVAFVLRRTVLRGPSQPFILELPPYRLPHWRTVLIAVWERVKVFLVQAGTIILAVNIILWFLVTFPADKQVKADFASKRALAAAELRPGPALDARLQKLHEQEEAELLRGSFAGRMGRAIEPVIRPLGFDWKIGVGLVASFAAREVLVSTLAVIYGTGDGTSASRPLTEAMQNDLDPRTGRHVFNLLVALNLILFYLLACQCLATLAVVKRETNGWKWPLFLFGYMTVLAYTVCFVFYQIASRLFPGYLA